MTKFLVVRGLLMLALIGVATVTTLISPLKHQRLLTALGGVATVTILIALGAYTRCDNGDCC